MVDKFNLATRLCVFSPGEVRPCRGKLLPWEPGTPPSYNALGAWDTPLPQCTGSMGPLSYNALGAWDNALSQYLVLGDPQPTSSVRTLYQYPGHPTLHYTSVLM